MSTFTAEPVLPAQAQLGEGALWADNRLFWIDIEGRALHRFDPATGQDTALPTGARIGTVVPFTATEALVALQTGLHKIDLRTGQLTLLHNPLTAPSLRFNDGKCDPAGRFWVGTLDLEQRPGAADLYCLDTDGSLRVVLNQVTNSNGLAWSPDARTMYYIDTPTRTVQVFDYEQGSGHIGHGRVLLHLPDDSPGAPDGMTLDADGNLWVAIWGGACVNCYHARSGALLHTVQVPALFTSSCAFGGPDLRTLYITSARVGLTPAELRQYPLSGDVFAAQVGVAGVPANRYRESPPWLP